jgi:uncharacterized membrane protein YGL010W
MSNKPVKSPPAGVDFYFDKFAAAHQNPVNKLVQITCIPLLLVGLFGLAWVIPFPYIKFLGQYNQDFNWSSFLIAASIYYYLKLSPILSYFMLFVELVICFAITELLQWQKTGGPALWLISLLVFILACTALFIGYQKEGKPLSFEYRYKNLAIAPIFLLHLVLKRFSIKY